MIGALLSPLLWRGIAVAGGLAGLAWGYNTWAAHQQEVGADRVRPKLVALQAAWDADKAIRAEKTRLLFMARDKETARLQTDADKERVILNDKNRAINRELTSALDRLRDRPSRPAEPPIGVAGVPTHPEPPSAGPGDGGGTGKGLYKQDGEFLVWEAADAKRLQAALLSCRANYQRAVETVNVGQ